MSANTSNVQSIALHLQVHRSIMVSDVGHAGYAFHAFSRDVSMLHGHKGDLDSNLRDILAKEGDRIGI